MKEQETIIQKILAKKQLNPEDVIISPVYGDGNCFYRAISLYFTNDESKYKIIREIIYETAKETKENLKPFFLNALSDNILADYKLEQYIEKIQNDAFYAGIIELSIAANIFDRTIIVYSIEEKKVNIELKNETQKLNKKSKLKNKDNENINKEELHDILETNVIYEHLATIEKPNENYNNLDNIIVLLYDRNIRHFSLILLNSREMQNNHNILIRESKQFNLEDLSKENVIELVKSQKKYFKKVNINEGEYIDDLNTTKFISKKGFNSYYEDIYAFLISKEKALDLETNKIDWGKVKYPNYVYNLDLNKKQKDKKREIFRNRCNKYIIINNNLYIKDKYYHTNKVKFQIPLETEKYNLIRTIHIKNGYLGGNRTVTKIIEAGYKWINMINDVLDYIKYECKECINMKSGEKLVIKSKVLITKGPKERFVIDGFQLDEITKEITGYSYVIEIIDHFSKFLKSYPVKENNAKNALLCIKDFCNYIGFPKILQSDNGSEYKNNIIKEYCETNNINLSVYRLK